MSDKSNYLATHNQRRICIAQDKERARSWVEERRFKRKRLVVAEAEARVPKKSEQFSNFTVDPRDYFT